ncbi:hypothetical protein ACJRO7_001801 [Eucalyptus globulus]|uniref:Uncharacterized protein n=1 Tax=Eucalyptus globulus TaxID=34317 RepID=A0ABD3LS60_EUCGL
MKKKEEEEEDMYRSAADVLDLGPAFLAGIPHDLEALLEQARELLRPVLHLLLEAPHRRRRPLPQEHFTEEIPDTETEIQLKKKQHYRRV